MRDLDKALSRFWTKVAVRGPDECWPWQAGTDPCGYGKFKYDGRDVGAHRFAYEAEKGEIEPGHVVRHRCDNPPCCNPRHLFACTHADNMADMVLKGRHKSPNRDRHANTKLSEVDVAFIRTSSLPGTELTRRFGVAKSTISYARRGPGPSFNKEKRRRVAEAAERLRNAAAQSESSTDVTASSWYGAGMGPETGARESARRTRAKPLGEHRKKGMERVPGIEPGYSAWKAY